MMEKKKKKLQKFDVITYIQECFGNKNIVTVQFTLYHIAWRKTVCGLSQYFIKNGLAFHLP